MGFYDFEENCEEDYVYQGNFDVGQFVCYSIRRSDIEQCIFWPELLFNMKIETLKVYV